MVLKLGRTSSSVSEMKIIPGTIPEEGWTYLYLGINEDKNLIMLEKWEDWEEEVFLWVVNTSGKDKREILSARIDGDIYNFMLNIEIANGNSWTLGPMSRGWAPEWFGNRIVIEGKYVDSNVMSQSYPYFEINPFTLESTLIDTRKLYDGGAMGYGEIKSNDQEYVIYYGNIDDDISKEFVLQNRVDYSGAEIFKWLSEEDWIEYNSFLGRFRFWADNSDKVTMAIVQEYGFDLGVNIDLETMLTETEYDNVMEAISIHPNMGYLEDGYRALLSVNRWTSEFSNLYSVYGVPDREFFYVFDADESTLRDYCLVEYGFPEFHFEISPDEKYIAWNTLINEEAVMLILELESGKIYRNQNIRFRDWVRLKE